MSELEQVKLIERYAPYLIPFLGAILIIVFTKQYLFRGMISADLHQDLLRRERRLIRTWKATTAQLAELTGHLEALAKRTSEQITQVNERTASLEHAMSDYLDEMRTLNKSLGVRPCLTEPAK